MKSQGGSAIKSCAKGYTLVELLIVVSIIAVISALVVLRILPAAAGTGDVDAGLMERAAWEAAACRFNQNIVQNATEYFAIVYGHYPATPADLFPRFLDRIPRCPATGAEYHYDAHHLVVCPYHP